MTMTKEIWVDGKLVETMKVGFDTPKSSNNDRKYKQWASNYRKTHK